MPEQDVDSQILSENKYVRFSVADEGYGVDIMQVRYIERMTVITKIPKAPQFIEGVISLRGTVVPILDLRKRFDIEEKEADNDTRILIVEAGEKTVGIIVDAVFDVTTISENTIEPPPPMVAGIDSEYIKGVAKRQDELLILLDLNKILNPEEVGQLKQVT